MVLSRKKLRQKLRELTAAAAPSTEPDSDAVDGEVVNEIQSIRGILKSKSRKPKSTQRTRKTNEVPAPDEDLDKQLEERRRLKKEKKEEKKRRKLKEREEKEKEGRDGDVVSGNVNKIAKCSGGRDNTNGDKISEVCSESDCDPKKVYVGGIPYYSTEDDIRSFFEGCGSIVEVDCMTFPESGKFRGIAILTFKTEAAAKRALSHNGSDMGGFYLKIQPFKANNRVQKEDFAPQMVEGYSRIYIGNLSWDITEDELKQLFTGCKILTIRFGYDKETGDFRGYAHVDFADSSSLSVALKLDQKLVCGRPVRIRCAVPKKAGESKLDDKKPYYTGPEKVKTEKRKPNAEKASDWTFGDVASLENPREKKKQRICYQCGIAGHLSSNCPQKKTTEDDTGKKLDEKENDKSKHDDKKADNPTTLYAASSENQNKKRKQRTCYECGTPGHLSSECPQKKTDDADKKLDKKKAEEDKSGDEKADNPTSVDDAISSENSKKKKKRRTCYKCRMPGHLSSDCLLKNAAQTAASVNAPS